MLLVLLALALTGCVSLPEQGGVQSVRAENRAEGETLVDYTPGGPKKDSAPVPLVENWLLSMTATPMNTYVARQFLTSGSSGDWVPERGTLVYGGHSLVSLPDGSVELRLRDVVELDDRGTWLGAGSRGSSRDYTLKLVREDGELRIADPPNRLIIPRLHFDTQYQQYFLYFFDKSAQALVPEPVYVPRGLQAPTLLVAALVKGPRPALDGVEGTFLPTGTRLDGISVPVSRDGTAEVPLSHDVLEVDDSQLNLLFAQLAWTLGQIAGVERMRVTVDGTPSTSGARAWTSGSTSSPSSTRPWPGPRPRCSGSATAGWSRSPTTGRAGSAGRSAPCRSACARSGSTCPRSTSPGSARTAPGSWRPTRTGPPASRPPRPTYAPSTRTAPTCSGRSTTCTGRPGSSTGPARARGSRWCGPASRARSGHRASPGRTWSASCSAATAPGWSPSCAAVAGTAWSSPGWSGTPRAGCAPCCRPRRCR